MNLFKYVQGLGNNEDYYEALEDEGKEAKEIRFLHRKILIDVSTKGQNPILVAKALWESIKDPLRIQKIKEQVHSLNREDLLNILLATDTEESSSIGDIIDSANKFLGLNLKDLRNELWNYYYQQTTLTLSKLMFGDES